MYQDPYKVLGVSPDDSDETIKKSYRELAKKYHPDRNPGNEEAARRMNEINAAYDAIKSGAAKQQASQQAYGGGYGQGYSSGYSSGYGGGGSAYGWEQNPFRDFYSGFGSYEQQQNSYRQRSERSEYTAARNYIRNGMYREAFSALSGVPENERDARWYYLAGYAHMYMGNKVTALNFAKKACDMEPDNEDYRRLLLSLQSGGDFYNSYSTAYRNNCNVSRALYLMCIANLICGPACGGRVICC